jgi:hypothetical protein
MNLQEIIKREISFIDKLSLECKEKTRLFQMFYRSLTFDSQVYFLLHGSVAISKKGKTILFGDGVDCIGKTSTALQTALSSGKFVVDEYVLYNQMTGSVYGNEKIPLVLRKDGVSFHKEVSDYGFETVGIATLDVIISPHPFEGESYLVEEKNWVKKSRKLAIVANAHRLKFLENSLDRMNGEKDKTEKIEIVDYTPGFQIPEGLFLLPYYDAYLNKPEDIVGLLERENL